MSTVNFPKNALFFHSAKQQSYRATFHSLPHQTRFSTHQGQDKLAATCYHFGQNIMCPWRLSTRFLGQAVTPLPGHNRSSPICRVAVRIACFIGFLTFLPIGVLSLGFGLPFHLYSHRLKPFISCIDNSASVGPDKEKNSLDLRSYNVAFIYEAMRIAGNLRSPIKRADEIAERFLAEDNPPDLICFQEGFHNQASKTLLNQLKQKYPYIIHSVDPHFFGLNSGLMIASKLKIEEVFFRPFTNMLGPEKLSTRGLLGIRVDLGNNRYANIYNTHLQSLLGKKRSQIRMQQLQQVVQWMDEDDQLDQQVRNNRKKVGDFLMGDLNMSHINAWGYENPAEDACRQFLEQHFYDPFYEEHDQNGERIKGKPLFLDNSKYKKLQEPFGSWYIGPFADKGLGLKIKDWYEKHLNRFSQGKRVKVLEKPLLWGTPGWTDGPRTANTARFDYQVMRKRANMVKGVSEIEHVVNHAQSGPSDHLPIRAIYNF